MIPVKIFSQLFAKLDTGRGVRNGRGQLGTGKAAMGMELRIFIE